MPLNAPPDVPDQTPQVILKRDRFEEYWRKTEIDPELVSKTAPYTDSVRFIEERHSTRDGGEPFPESLSDIPPETLRHYLRYFEALIVARVEEPLTIPTTMIDKFQYHGALLAIAMYKILLEEGEITDPVGQPQKLSTVENAVSNILKTVDPSTALSTLLRVGQDAGNEYAPAASKLLHLFRYQTPPGKEVIDVAWSVADDGKTYKTGRRKRKMPDSYIVSRSSYDLHDNCMAFARSEKPRERAMAWKYLTAGTDVTPPHKIARAAMLLLEENALPSLAQKYEELFGSIIKCLARIFLHKFHNEDGGIITDENVYTLCIAHLAAARLKFLDATSDHWPADSSERIHREVSRISQTFSGEMGDMLEQHEIEKLSAKFAEYGTDIPEPYKERLLPIMKDIFQWLPAIAQALNRSQDNPDALFWDANVNIARHIVEDQAALARSPLVRFAAFRTFIRFGIKLNSPVESPESKRIAQREIRKRNAEDILLTPARDILLNAIDGADNPCELANMLEMFFHSLRCRIDMPEVQFLIEKIVAGMEKYPDALSKIIHFSIPEDPGKDELMVTMNTGVPLRIFPVMLRSPVLREQFFAVLTQPDYRTHYNACCVAAYVIKKEGGRGSFTTDLFRRFFKMPTDCTDQVKMAVIRNVLERLPDTAREIFLKEFLNLPILQEDATVKQKAHSLLGQFGEQAQKNIELEINRTRRRLTAAQARAEAQERKEAPLKLLQSLSAQQFPRHDLLALIQDIIEHRSIVLSDDGHRVTLDKSESPLRTTFQEARVKKNKETGNPPRGLACNITFVSAAGINVYCRLGIDGEFMIRLLNEQQQESGIVTRSETVKYGISEELFDELHALVLEVLSMIYLRKETADVTQQQEQARQQETSPAQQHETSELIATHELGLPIAHEREVGTMRISLPHEETETERRRIRAERRFIETNKERVRTAFAALATGDSLPEASPDELSQLRLFLAVSTDANAGLGMSPRLIKVFEPMQNPAEVYEAIRNGTISIDDVWIRISRAFAQPLPYVAYERRLSSVDEQSPPKSLWVVRQKRPRPDATSKHTAFIIHEQGEELNLAGKTMRLHFEADERQDPALRGMTEKLNAPVFDVEHGRIIEPEEIIREIDTGKFELIADGFEFKQTFNYGQFITLRELLFGKQEEAA